MTLNTKSRTCCKNEPRNGCRPCVDTFPISVGMVKCLGWICLWEVGAGWPHPSALNSISSFKFSNEFGNEYNQLFLANFLFALFLRPQLRFLANGVNFAGQKVKTCSHACTCNNQTTFIFPNGSQRFDGLFQHSGRLTRAKMAEQTIWKENTMKSTRLHVDHVSQSVCGTSA